MRCRIRIEGHLDLSWQSWFDDLEIIQEEQGTTILRGQLPDQAALYGVLLKLDDLGLLLLALEVSKTQGQID